ncbi:MAG: hypothetical protein QXR62_05045 [Candidatus Bathyarchaeia archaeon]
MPDVLTHYTVSVLIAAHYDRSSLSNYKSAIRTFFMGVFGLLPDVGFPLGIHRGPLHGFLITIPLNID